MPKVERESRRAGFTLLELIMAIMILSIMTVLSFFAFDAVVSSWNAGMAMADAMAQADYVMNQIQSGLRSAYFSESLAQAEERGFHLLDDGEGENARDSISWMKEGRAFVGSLKAIDGKTEIAEMPHRVMLYVEEGGGMVEGGLMVKAWSNDFQPDDFDAEEDVKAFLISSRVSALDCKVLEKPPSENSTDVEWLDEWSSSNTLPYKVSITLYLKPLTKRGETLAVTRDIEVPVWDVSQNPVQSSDSSRTRRPGALNSGDTMGRRPGQGGTGGSGRGNAPGGGMGGGGRGNAPGGGMGGAPGGMGGP